MQALSCDRFYCIIDAHFGACANYKVVSASHGVLPMMTIDTGLGFIQSFGIYRKVKVWQLAQNYVSRLST